MVGIVIAEIIGYASTDLFALFLVGIRTRIRLCFLLLALLALSQVPCKKRLEFLILEFLFGSYKLLLIPDGRMGDKRGPAGKKGNGEVESGDKRIRRCITDR
jgi:hypothetical protein